MELLFGNPVLRVISSMSKIHKLCLCVVILFSFFFTLPINAKDFFSAPQEKDILTCIDGTVLRGMFYKTQSPVRQLKVYDKKDCIMLKDESNVYRLCNKHTFNVIAEQRSLPVMMREGYLLDRQPKPSFYNLENEKLWTASGPYVYYSDSLGIVVCEKGNGSKRQLQGLDMKTGEILWESVVPYKYHYPWAEILSVEKNPDYKYLIADSLYLINTKTGALKARAFSSSVKEPSKSVFSIARSVPLPTSDWRNDAAFSYDFMGRISGTHSQWVQSGDSLFIADATNLYCFNLSLEEIWHTPFPEGMSGKSDLQLRGNKLYILNYGIGFQKGMVGRAGMPFYATFDKSTGRQTQFMGLNTNKKLYGGRYVPGRIYLQDIASLYYVDEGSDEVHPIKWTPDTDMPAEYNIPEQVIYDTVYVKREGKLEAIVTDDRQLVVELNDYDINIIKCTGEVTKYSGAEVFFHDYGNVYSTNSRKVHHYAIVADGTLNVRYEFYHAGFCLVTDSGDIWVVDKNGIGVVKDCK